MAAYLTTAMKSYILARVRGAQERYNVKLVLDRTALALAADISGTGTITPAAVEAAIGATTDITAVPGSFADLAAVRTYLNGANMVANIETRLDNLEAKSNAILAKLKTAGVISST